MTFFPARMKATALIAALSCTLVSETVHAQDQQQATQAQQVQSFVNMYRMVDYSLGANESCDLFTIGNYRALWLLHSMFRSKLRAVATDEQLEQMRPFDKAKQAWSGCIKRADNAEAWSIIDKSELLAEALIAAPLKVSIEPKDCRVAWGGPALSRNEWGYAATAAVSKYDKAPNKAEFEALQGELAAMIDEECVKRQSSELMQAGYEQLRHTEDNHLFLQKGKPGKKQVFTSVGSDIVSDPVSDDFGIWRSRRGGFSRYPTGTGVIAYRVLDTSDVDVALFMLSRPGTYSAGGKMYLSRAGRMTARMDGNFDAIELRISNGQSYPLTKLGGQGTGNFTASSKFALPADAQGKLAKLNDELTMTIAYRIDGKDWASFLEIGKDASTKEISLDDIRSSLEWSNAPMAARDDR